MQALIADLTEAAGPLVDLDAIKGNRWDAAESMTYRLAGHFEAGKRKVWVLDDKKRLHPDNVGGKKLGVAIRDAILDGIAEGMATDSERVQGGGKPRMKELSRLEKKFKNARFKVEPKTSPRTGKRGYLITLA